MTTTPEMKIKAPFPAFGGKSQVADLVWERLGDPRNFIEPFAFSAAMLLRRPNVGPIETINDLNMYVSNFWRAIKFAPEEVAEHADWPVNETDLHARHRWLVQSAEAQAELAHVRADPEYFNAKIAGWWCWGACCWIGSGWCDTQKLPHMDAAGKLVNSPPDFLEGTSEWVQRHDLHSNGTGISKNLSQQTPRLSAVGQAIHATAKRPQLNNGCQTAGPGVLGHPKDASGEIRERHQDGHRPQLADAFSRGRGVNGNDAAGTCEQRRQWLLRWFGQLSDRLRPVRVCCGHWARVCDSPSTLTRLGLTGVFLDPPYRHTIDGAENRSKKIYANDDHQDVDALCDEVEAWCLKWGDEPEIRIALCGLEGEYPKLDAAGWDKVAWKSRGGYGNRTERGQENAARERIWFNRNCVQPTLGGLFTRGDA